LNPSRSVPSEARVEPMDQDDRQPTFSLAP
jgi:hypothetical protein